MFVSTPGHSGGTPVPSKVMHHVARQLGKRLALAGWVPPAASAVAADPTLAEEAHRASLAAFDRAPAKMFVEVVKTLRDLWRSMCSGKPEIERGLALIENDYIEAAVAASTCVDGAPPNAVVSLMVAFVEPPTVDPAVLAKAMSSVAASSAPHPSQQSRNRHGGGGRGGGGQGQRRHEQQRRPREHSHDDRRHRPQHRSEGLFPAPKHGLLPPPR
uniref:Uncharacterized protein n=1 Tax=Neobodo designis TaxID=312471 RepID=A0A7S1L873_NEODS|mmetsp:Transcript_16592/g.51466  ORF Transcript_16592/g.51466 Transcript_16592/m.51466 type:complete len:215 (+) Transcript_16592:535-1179(+)